MECPICFEIINESVQCNQCKQSICLFCYSRIIRCAFCRKRYNPTKHDRIMEKMEQIIELIERLDRMMQSK